MQLEDYYFEFPEELIGTKPQQRGLSSIMVCKKDSEEHQIIKAKEIVDLFHETDCLVVNNTKVIPARLFGQKSTGGKVEILLIEPKGELEGCCWEAWVKPGKSFKPGSSLHFGNTTAEVIKVQEDGSRVLKFDATHAQFEDLLMEQGKVPLPPYISREVTSEDKEFYQSIFAKYNGAVAAPTASLHFSEEMMEELKAKGVAVAEVTLHVGPGTFQNIETSHVEDHQMHGERFWIDQENADLINSRKAAGGKIITVGTTSTRVLESVADEDGKLKEDSGVTYKYIYPGYKWKIVDGLITNFHWPKSSLILLVSSFYGKEKTLNAYHHAIDNKMKLFSYGDGMFIF